MGKLGYYFRIAKSAFKPKKITRMVDRVYERCGRKKNKFVLFCDMCWSGIRYGAGWNDYLVFKWYDMNREQRESYVTRMRNKKIILALNDQSVTHVIDHKGEFRKKFEKYLGREVVDIDGLSFEAFEKFVENKDAIIAKPYIGESGKGIEKLNKADFESVQAFFDYVTSGKFGLVEELIVQHPDLARVYPLSVNAYRIVTVIGDDGEVYCVNATIKFGADGNFVDNVEHGGMHCPIDLKTGIINGVSHNAPLENFYEHPNTGVKFIGYQLPMVHEAIELCRQAALEVAPQIRYIGWDAFVTEKGVGIIEGNDYPGYDFWQLPEHTPDKIGLMPFYKKIIPSVFK